MLTVLPDQVPAWLFWLHPSCCERKQSVPILWSHLTLFNGERSFFVLFYIVLPWPAAGLAPIALYGFCKDSHKVIGLLHRFLGGCPGTWGLSWDSSVTAERYPFGVRSSWCKKSHQCSTSSASPRSPWQQGGCSCCCPPGQAAWEREV